MNEQLTLTQEEAVHLYGLLSMDNKNEEKGLELFYDNENVLNIIKKNIKKNNDLIDKLTKI